MGISLRAFIGKYLYREETQDALEFIGEKVSGSNDEIESRLASEWPKYQDIYNLLDYVDEDRMLEMCEQFEINTNAITHGALKKRIKQAGIITGYSQNTLRTKKSKSHSVHMTEDVKVESNLSVIRMIRSKQGKIGIPIILTVIFFIANPWYSFLVTDLTTETCVSGEIGLTYKNCELGFELTRPSPDWVKVKDYESFVDYASTNSGYLGGYMISKLGQGNITIHVYDKNFDDNNNLESYAWRNYYDMKTRLPDWDITEPIIEKDFAVLIMKGEIEGAEMLWKFQLEFNNDKLYLLHTSIRTDIEHSEFSSELQKAFFTFGYLN